MVSSDPHLLVLHALRLKGFVDAEVIAEFTGLNRSEVDVRLQVALGDGSVNRRTGTRSGWSLTPEGRKEGERLLAVELDELDRRAEVTSAYQDFLDLNPELLETCRAWQVRDQANGTLNDHTDDDYDRQVVERLAAIDASIRPILDRLAVIARFERYEPRLALALDHVRAGRRDWLTRPTLDSYHTVWFELHEDLLATLGLERADERASDQRQEVGTDVLPPTEG